MKQYFNQTTTKTNVQDVHQYTCRHWRCWTVGASLTQSLVTATHIGVNGGVCPLVEQKVIFVLLRSVCVREGGVSVVHKSLRVVTRYCQCF